jgi:hypothetical protein
MGGWVGGGGGDEGGLGSTLTRSLLPTFTAAELEEADSLVGDVMKEAGQLVSHLSEEQAQQVLDGLKQGVRPVAQRPRDQMVIQELERMREEDEVVQQHALDDVLREGEALLNALPHADAIALLQEVKRSSNKSPVAVALRTHARAVEEDAIFQAEALLYGEQMVEAVLNQAASEDKRVVYQEEEKVAVVDELDTVLREGELVLEALRDEAAFSILEHIKRPQTPLGEMLRRRLTPAYTRDTLTYTRDTPVYTRDAVGRIILEDGSRRVIPPLSEGGWEAGKEIDRERALARLSSPDELGSGAAAAVGDDDEMFDDEMFEQQPSASAREEIERTVREILEEGGNDAEAMVMSSVGSSQAQIHKF